LQNKGDQRPHQTKTGQSKKEEKNAGLKSQQASKKTVNAESSMVAVNGLLAATSPVPPPTQCKGRKCRFSLLLMSSCYSSRRQA
jgi:hypothetical protein